MKLIISIFIACVALKATALPTSRSSDIKNREVALSDPDMPLRVYVKTHTSRFVESYKNIITNVLDQIPQTEVYEDVRKFLQETLDKNDELVKDYANCMRNLADLLYTVKSTILYLTRPSATAEEKDVANQLNYNGYDEMRLELKDVWWTFIIGELGATYNDDYCRSKK